MTEFMINDYLVEQEAIEIAKQGIKEEREFGVPALEYVQQACDGHEWVIYTYKAIKLCAECNTDEGEQYLDDCGLDQFDSFGDHATRLAYATMLGACQSALFELQ